MQDFRGINETKYAVSGVDGCAQLACTDIFKRLKKGAYIDKGDSTVQQGCRETKLAC